LGLIKEETMTSKEKSSGGRPGQVIINSIMRLVMAEIK